MQCVFCGGQILKGNDDRLVCLQCSLEYDEHGIVISIDMLIRRFAFVGRTKYMPISPSNKRTGNGQQKKGILH